MLCTYNLHLILAKMWLIKRVQLPNNWFQYYAAVSANSLLVTTGLCFGWPSPSIPKLLDGSHVKVSSVHTSWLAILPLLSSIVGALASVVLLDRIGRKPVMLFLGGPFLISWLLIAFANGVEMLYAARLISGVMDGFALTAIPMYIGEIADAQLRGLFGSLVTVAIILGSLVINGVGLYLSIYTTALISAAFPIAFMIMFAYAAESPYYLIMKERNEEAKTSLRRLKGVQDVDDEFVRLTNAIQDDQRNTGRFLDLFTVASNRKAMLIVCGLRLVQQFSGITAVTFYTPLIISSEHIVVIYYGVQLIMTCLSSLIVDKAGRRPLLLFSSIATGMASFCTGAYFYLRDETDVDLSQLEFAPALAMISYIILYSAGLSTIPLLMLSEVFPTNVKSFAIGVAATSFSVGASAASQFFFYMQTTVGMYVGFVGFGVFIFVGTIFIYIWVPETKGKTLEEVVEHFRRNTKTKIMF